MLRVILAFLIVVFSAQSNAYSAQCCGLYPNAEDPISGGVATTDIDMLGYYIYSSTGPLELGGAFTTGHGLTTSDVGILGKLEIDDELFADAAANFATTVDITGILTASAGVTLQNADTITNAVDGQIVLTGVGGANNLDLIVDLETVAATIGFSSATATVIDIGTLNLALAALSVSGNLTLESGGTVDTTSNGNIVLAPNGSGYVDVLNSELYIGDGTYAPGHSPTLYTEGRFEADGPSYFDDTLEIASTLSAQSGITFSNAEKISNAVDDQFKFESAGGTNNESLILDLDASANLATWLTDSGVLTISYSALNLLTTGTISGAAITSTADITAAAASKFLLLGLGGLGAGADGAFYLTDTAGTSVTSLAVGPYNDILFPMLKRVSAGLHLRLGNDSAFTDLSLNNLFAWGNVFIGSSAKLYWDGKTRQSAPLDGQVLYTKADNVTGAILDFSTASNVSLIDVAGTGAATLTLGLPGDPLFPMFKRSATNILARLGDDSAYASIWGLHLTAAGSVTAGAANYFSIAGLSRAYAPADGQWKMTKADGTTGAIIDVSTADDITFRNAADTENADITAATVTVDTYTRCITFPPSAAVLGPTAPGYETVGTYRLIAFDQTTSGEVINLSKEIPSDWIGTTDMSFKVYWTNEAGSALGDTDAVKWDATYRSTTWETDTITNGSAVSITGTYTQSGAGTDGETFEQMIVVDHDDVNQPISAGDVISFEFSRDEGVANDYAADALFAQAELCYDSNTWPDHN